MKRYLVCLLSFTLLMVLATFVVMWCRPQSFIVAMPLVMLYFAIVTGLEHIFIVKSAYKAPRVFIKNFLGATVGSLLLNLVVVMAWAFLHMQDAKLFLITFLIGYIAYLAFETTALLLFVKRQKDSSAHPQA